MALNKLFGKKKEEKYFLEVDTKTENKPSAEVVVNAEDSKVETPETKGKEATATSTPKPIASTNATYDVPEWVKAIKNYSKQNNNASDTKGENFAGKYISNNVSQSRRRPGPSLAVFKNMASKINR